MSDAGQKKSTFGLLMRMALGMAIGVGIVVGADPQTKFLRVTDSATPPGALRMTLAVLLIAALYFWGGQIVARSRRFAVSAPLTATGRPKLRRGHYRGGYRALQWQVILCLWLWYAYPDQWTWQSVGLKDEVPIALSALIGVSAYGVLLAVLTFAVRCAGDEGKFLDGTVRSMAALIPRAKKQKRLTWTAFCVFNPFIEELLFRGVLVYQTALAAGTAWWPIAVGLVVNIGNHWYQGGRSMALHVPFYAIAIGLLFSQHGLVGAIAFHAAGDIVPMALVRRHLRQFRERHREFGDRSEEFVLTELG